MPFRHSAWPEWASAERSLDLARRGVEQATNDTARAVGVVRARVLRMVNGSHNSMSSKRRSQRRWKYCCERMQRAGCPCFCWSEPDWPECAVTWTAWRATSPKRGACSREMGVTGWDDYARSIETAPVSP